jgi:hypothetical protein
MNMVVTPFGEFELAPEAIREEIGRVAEDGCQGVDRDRPRVVDATAFAQAGSAT